MSSAKIDVFRSDTRGLTRTSWLTSRHSFCFGEYYDPKRIRFGFLRVFNDDWIGPSSGFPPHAHENMEIVSIILEGELEHRDSLGHRYVLKKGAVQRMSAGKGIQHSEMNPSQTEKTHFLQAWVFPRVKNQEPSYEEKHFDFSQMGKWQTLVSPVFSPTSLSIDQEVIFSYGAFEQGTSVSHTIKEGYRGVFVFVIEGDLLLGDEHLQKGDSVEIINASSLSLQSESPSKILLVESL